MVALAGIENSTIDPIDEGLGPAGLIDDADLDVLARDQVNRRGEGRPDRGNMDDGGQNEDAIDLLDSGNLV